MSASRLASLDDLKAERAKRRLVPFMERMWRVLEPKTPFRANWHIGAIAEHLEAVSLRQLSDLLINVPPGCSKTYIVSVFWPAWEWIQRPEERYLCGSFQESLSIIANRNSRSIIESELYQRHWPLKLRADQNTKTQFDNLKTGWRIGTSVGGRGTGLHPTRKIIDDPHNVKESLSDLQREEALTWFSGTMSSRGASKEINAATVVIMQRLHQDDLSGHILETLPHFTHICLPMRYEPPAWVEIHKPDGTVSKALKPRMPPTPLGWQDPRTTPGELLWEALFDEPAIAKLEANIRSKMGEFGVAGQMQQRPVPESGGLFKIEKLPIIEAIPKGVRIVARARGWDCAATSGGGDYSATVLIARGDDGLTYVEHVLRGQWGPAEFEGPQGLFINTIRSDPPWTRQREEEEGGSAGKKVTAAHGLLTQGYDFLGVRSTGDKVTRAMNFVSQVALGNVRLVKGEWNRAYIDELCLFPNGRYDDQVDASSLAYNEIWLNVIHEVGTVQLSGW